MKKLLTTMFNSSIFRYVQRIAVVCVLLSFALTATAGNDWSGTAYAYAKFAESSSVANGVGKVYVGTNETPTYKKLSEDAEANKSTASSETDPKNVDFWWAATAAEGTNSAFAGWFTDAEASTKHTDEAKFKASVQVKKDPDKKGSLTFYAHFRKVIDAPVEVAWTKTTEKATTTFDVNLYKAENFRVKSSAHKDGLARTFSAEVKAEDLSDQKAKITMSAGADVVDGDVFNVVLTTDNGGDVTVQVKIVAKITVRFELPKRGQGYYEAIQPNNGGNRTYNSKDAGESRDINLTDTKQFFQKITASPADGYRLYRWVVTDKNGNTTYPTSNPLTKTLNEGDVISVEFLPTDLAQFMVKDDPDQKLFYELDSENGAFKHAEKLGKKVVVVHTSGTLYAEYKSLTNGKYEFTIPAGYTLLVPCDAEYSMATGLEKKYMVDFSGTPTMYRKLTLPSNVRINANGHICVFALLSQTQGHNGKPKTYGQIAMSDASEIILNSGSQLTAYGYVTGTPSKSRVVAKSGAKVYEAFQMMDWRGGTQTTAVIGNDQRVFPLAQFYVQNVETKLTIQHGATLYVCATAAMGSGILHQQIPLTMELVAKDNGNETDNGFFCLGTGCEVSKWYDGENDRQVYQINKMDIHTGVATAKMGRMYDKILSIYTLDSRQYVLLMMNNMDVTFCPNVKVTNPNDLAFLAGAQINIQTGAEVISEANLFVYDKEHNTGYFGASGSPLIPLTYTAYHYDKYLSNKTTYSYLKTGKPLTGEKDDKGNYIAIRTTSNLQDAKMTIDGKLVIKTKNSGLQDGSGFYTTAKGGSGTSGEDADYGAIITSNGGGVVDFQYVGGKKTTYQLKGENVVEIPVTNARLRNADNSWSAGDTLTTKDEYTYSLEKGRWVTPQEISFGNWDNNKWLVRLPEPSTVTQTVEISLITKEILTMDNFEIEWPANAYFAKGGNATYDAENKKLLVPITYTLTKVHNKDVEPNAYVGSLVVKCKDLNVTGDVVAEANIPLTAVEDYTPEFTVTINAVSVTTGDTYDFGQTYAQVPVEANLVITPIDTTVAQLSATQWSIVATGSFNASQTSVTYNPQAKSADEGETGTLTIIATYSDAATPVPNKPADTIIVNLQGKAILQESTLLFKDNLTTEIYQADKITDVFSGLGNGSDVTFTYTYTDGTPANDLLVESKQNGNYTLTANTTDYVDNRVVVVTATQGATDVMAGASRHLTVTIKPVVAWNWSTLYFNTERDNPVTVARAGDWTLTEQTDPNDLVTLSGTTPNYSATIGAGDAAQVYNATFKFVQGSYQKIFTSSIYADPRALGFCVDYVRQFNDVSTPTVTTVTFDENSHKTTFRPGDTWEINMTGMPDKLTFTATGNNLWYIGERASSSTNYNDVVAWSKLSGTQTIQLKPTTNQVIIQYGAGDNNGTITNLCISELEISADKDAIYFPINKDGSETTKKLILTHTEPTSPEVSLDSHFTTTLSAVSNNLGTTPEEPYYQTTVTISGDMSAVEKGSYVLTATQGTAKITIPVHADEFPQGLPIKLATDDAKRYHFVAVETDKVTWDEANRNVVFQTPEGEQTIRSVTFAFEGAPSRIKFTASQDIIDNQWRVEEWDGISADGFQVSGLANRDTETGTKFVHNLQYTTRYVRVVYNSENKSEIELSDLVIEGDPMLLVNPEELEFSTDDRNKSLTLTAINLNNIRIELDNVTDFQMSHGAAEASATYTLSSADYPNALGVNKVGDIEINTEWITNSIVNDGMITIYNVDDNDSILAKVKLVGAGKYLHKADAKTTGLYTGIPDGTRDTDGDDNPNTDYKYTYHGADYTAYQYHQIDLSNTFAEDGTALFDYLFVYGETTTTDATTNITAPAGESGSNARTPYYVYIRDVDAYGNFDRYRFVTMLDNANIGNKQDLHVQGVTTNDSSLYINVPKDAAIRVYITGFCPYASTGADKSQEGVFFFRGMAGSKLDVYLENAYLFARNKMLNGQPFYTRGDSRNPSFTGDYARGSGGVLVFENMESTEDLTKIVPFDVTIHTVGNNLLKSNYGCFNYFFGMDPFQISAPIHVRLHSKIHVSTSKTVVNFTDEWPTALNADRSIKTSRRTNGFLSLQKLNNNAPSIDLGNPLTEVNFRGGQVELQNAQIVSTNYKTTLAISYRSGEYGGDKVGLKFACGIGTDSVGGTVNFYDGTITIQPMWVAEEYKNYYMIDKDVNGNEIKKDTGKKDEYGQPIYEYQTTCLRTPKNTNVYGGSICWLRACQHVTSKGGAPSDGTGKLLGQYVYEFGDGDTKDATTGLVTKIKFPGNVEGLQGYYDTYHHGVYGLESVTPDANNKLYFWIPDGYGGVEPEKDNILTTWKACMTEISAGFGTLKGTVGGRTPVEQNEEIKYMLYCKIDENISNVITAGTGDGIDRVYSYNAPVKVPPVAQGYVGSEYTKVRPSMVGMELQNEVASDTSYLVTDKIYYVTNATADVWQTFTAPFDVEKIWVVESFSEAELKRRGQDSIQGKENANLRNAVLLEQARHNADFAAFFGVSMAIGTTDSLGTIFNDFVEWGKMEDKKDNLYNGQGDYTLRGKYPLIPYYRKADGIANFDEAHFYLNENMGNWTTEDGYQFTTQWKTLTESEVKDDGVLLHKGRTYAMLFPYCTGIGCPVTNRKDWDYWSGKFLIFESTDGKQTGGHVVDGSNLFDSIPFATTPNVNEAIVSGNSTFSYLVTDDPNVYIYNPLPAMEQFEPNTTLDGNSQVSTVLPTTAILWANIQAPASNMQVRHIKRTGEIVYGKENTSTDVNQGGNIPTVGGGNDLFITSTVAGINIAVAEPQHVRVMSATGAIIYSGMVQTAVDVALPTTGVYVITGENEVYKILH